MKFSLVAVVLAFLCATVVTGAPSTPNLSFEDLAEETEDLFDLDEFEYDELSNNLLEKLKCISEAISDGLKETDFAKPWETLKADLEKLGERVKACKKESSLLDIAKCVAKEAEGAKTIIDGFLTNLKKVNKEAHDRVVKYIKERCK